MQTRRLLGLFFSLILGGTGTGPCAEPTAPVVLRMLSYNIKHGRGMDGRVDLERIAAVIARMKPDLVALQEVDKNCKRSGHQDIAAELGRLLKMEHRFGKSMDFQGGEYGLAVLSRLPILSSSRHELPGGSEPRTALEVSVKAEGWPTALSFVSIHNDWKSAEIRDQQVTRLMELLQPRQTPIILAGDFNGTRQDSSLILLEKNHWTILRKTRGNANTSPSPEPQTEIDYFITRNLPGFRVDHFVVKEPLASDHRPIFAALSLRE